MWKVFNVNEKYTSKTAISWTNITFCFSVFIAVFDKQVNIRGSIGSISRPKSSLNHNAAYQAIANNIYISGKRLGAIRTDQKIILLSIIFAWWYRFSNQLQRCLYFQQENCLWHNRENKRKVQIFIELMT